MSMCRGFRNMMFAASAPLVAPILPKQHPRGQRYHPRAEAVKYPVNTELLVIRQLRKGVNRALAVGPGILPGLRAVQYGQVQVLGRQRVDLPAGVRAPLLEAVRNVSAVYLCASAPGCLRSFASNGA